MRPHDNGSAWEPLRVDVPPLLRRKLDVVARLEGCDPGSVPARVLALGLDAYFALREKLGPQPWSTMDVCDVLAEALIRELVDEQRQSDERATRFGSLALLPNADTAPSPTRRASQPKARRVTSRPSKP